MQKKYSLIPKSKKKSKKQNTKKKPKLLNETRNHASFLIPVTIRQKFKYVRL